MKTPFNWVGNKYKHIEIVNKIVKGNEYHDVIDLFMGSGNILFNIDVNCISKIGNDKIKLLPNIFNQLKVNDYTYSLNDIEDILNRFERFSTKESYYIFRDHWNKKYLNDEFDKDFILETILLLKMCSNSMVRFNPKEGYFNQGFRGLGKKKEFFTETMKNMVVEEINQISNETTEEYNFYNKDFLDYVEVANRDVKDLLILDPPYILRKDMYDTDWTEKHDAHLHKLLETTKNDFVYFNYLERDGVVNNELLRFINNNKLKYIEVNSKTLAGQGRSENIKPVKEVVVTNVQM